MLRDVIDDSTRTRARDGNRSATAARKKVKWNTVEQTRAYICMWVWDGSDDGGTGWLWWWWWFSIQLRIRKFAIFRHVFGIARACFILWEFLFEYYRHGVMPLFLCAHTHIFLQKQTFIPAENHFLSFAHLLTLIYCYFFCCTFARTQLLNAFRCFLKQWILMCFNRLWCVCCAVLDPSFTKNNMFQYVSINNVWGCVRVCVCVCAYVDCVCKSSEHNMQCVYFCHVKDVNKSSGIAKGKQQERAREKIWSLKDITRIHISNELFQFFRFNCTWAHQPHPSLGITTTVNSKH